MQVFEFILRIIQVLIVPLIGLVLKYTLDLRKQITSLDTRLTRAEACLESTPSERTLHKLSLSIREISGDLHVAVEKIEGMGRIMDRLERVVTRHEEFLLRGGK